MKILVHRKGKTPIKIISRNGEDSFLLKGSCLEVFWKMAAQYPNEIIGWCEEEIEPFLALYNWEGIFHQDLIMASYGVKTIFLPSSLGYIDELPFVNFPKNIIYGTWQMSSDVGGIKGSTLLLFRSLFKNEKNFSFLLNSIGKAGQKNGLFCYSSPNLLSGTTVETESIASVSQLFSFTTSHYNRLWGFMLFWFFIRYEGRFPFLAFLRSQFRKRYFKKKVDLSMVDVTSKLKWQSNDSVDVIIPTIGRPKFLLQVIEDLKNQNHLPKRVIVVEQNPDLNSISELNILKTEKFPFEIIHYFIHQTGVCNARNIALNEVTSDWVFLADDDNRIAPDFLIKALKEIRKYGINMVTTFYPQEGEKRRFDKVKQWGTFGAGNSIISSNFITKIKFDPAYEHGYGEDKDFGMQLRHSGCDIIYHPELEIIHLKAPIGGFRKKSIVPWEQEEGLKPKPSPTLLVYAKRYFSKEQKVGFKTILFLRFFFKQKNRNPFSYIETMKIRWSKSEKWAEVLLNQKK